MDSDSDLDSSPVVLDSDSEPEDWDSDLADSTTSLVLADVLLFCCVIVDDIQDLCENVGLNVSTVLHRRAGAERLSVLRCTHRPESQSPIRTL